ncbi:hypothetical protein ACFFRR_001890 [Megaselia abdita]
MSYLRKLKVLTTRYPVLRGMISYSIIWPTSSLIQQVVEGKTLDTIDWWRCARFSFFGGLFVAPSLYSWMRVSSAMWPETSLRTAIAKAAVETVTYTPAAMTCFYFLMTLLELRPFKEAVEEVRTKVPPTYRVAVMVWPVVATINFSLIPEKNRVPFISVCSLLWTSFLAYMKHLDASHWEEEHDNLESQVVNS